MNTLPSRIDPKSDSVLRTSMAGVQIVLAEDDDDARDTLASDLRSHGFVVDTAASGEELVDMLGAYEQRGCKPAAVVTDLYMPGFSGIEVLEGFRDAGWTTPLLLMTAFGGEQVRDQALSLGAVCYIEKPFDTVDLITSLRAAITESPGYAPSAEQTSSAGRAV